MRRTAIFLMASLLVGLSNGQALADPPTYEQKEAKKEKAREERAQRKEDENVTAQINKPAPLMHFNASRHSTPELSWLRQKKRKGDSVESLFLGK